MALFETKKETTPEPQSNGITYFAETDSRGQRVRFGIRDEDRTRHMYVIGQTGMGKSVLLENMAVQDVQNGNGLCFIDPHGSAIDEILNYIPEHRIEDVIYFAPFDLEHPISFNVMEDIGPDKRHLVAQGLLSAFKKIWGEETFSARMEHIVNNTLLALLEYPDTTILSMTRMLTEKAYRDKVVDHLKEPSVKAFWINEFGAWDDRYQKEAAAGVLNKVSQFVSNPLIRNIVGQSKSSFDFREAMDTKKIVLVNLSKGQVGEENSKLLGAMITTKVYLAAMSRADVTKQVLKTLPYFYLYVDEFQTVVNDSFESILSEARKYRLSLIIAHQYIEQMPELVQAAVFGNVGTRINFRVGATDAEYLEKSFGEKFLASDIVGLSRFQIYLILMIDGVGSQPFSARTLPPIELPEKNYREEIIASSRNLFAGNRKEIEDGIVAWMFDSADERKKKRDRNQRKKSNKRLREQGKPIPDRTGRGKGGVPRDDVKKETPIDDLPGATSFKDAFANLAVDSAPEDPKSSPQEESTETIVQSPERLEKKIKKQIHVKPSSPFAGSEVPASLKKDTKKYSIGAALSKKEEAVRDNKVIQDTRDVSRINKQQHLEKNQGSNEKKNKFAFTFDESSLAQKASHTLPPLHPVISEEHHPVVQKREKHDHVKSKNQRGEQSGKRTGQKRRNQQSKKTRQPKKTNESTKNNAQKPAKKQDGVKRGSDNTDLKNLINSL